VKSCVPCKDGEAQPGVENLMGILKNMLTYGDISPDKISRYQESHALLFWCIHSLAYNVSSHSHYSVITRSASDKAHLRLAAAKAVLRLSRQSDHKVPVDVFYLTLRISQVCSGYM
jgi:sister-chromatid-cohesion protein PDS5